MTQNEIMKLLEWYQLHKRDLPWRHTNDPYNIWISEIMLQQTRVSAVIFYYERFMSALPTIFSLAHASEDLLFKLWEGLGYYSRAKNLSLCAKEVLNRGLDTLPSIESEIRSLPGIGPYTAGAILSISYSKCVPAIDGNVLRVLSRIFKDDRDLLKKSVRDSYDYLLRSLMKEEYARDFTEAFIELGALVCLPNGTPKCDECPFSSICLSYQDGTMLNYPVKKKKTKRKVVNKTVFVLQFKSKFGIRKRDDHGLLAGLYEFFNVDNDFTIDEVEEYLFKQNICYTSLFFLGDFRHIFSHVEWQMKAYLIQVYKKVLGLSYFSRQEILSDYSLPTAFQKIFRSLKE